MMKELAEVCKKRGLSFIVISDNHKRFKESAQQYIQKMNPLLLTSDEGLKEVEEMALLDSIVTVDVYSHNMSPLFVVTSSNLDHALACAVAGIETKLKLEPGSEPIFLLQDET